MKVHPMAQAQLDKIPIDPERWIGHERMAEIMGVSGNQARLHAMHFAAQGLLEQREVMSKGGIVLAWYWRRVQ